MKLENNILLYLSTDVKIGVMGKWVPIFPKEKAINTINYIHNSSLSSWDTKNLLFYKEFYLGKKSI